MDHANAVEEAIKQFYAVGNTDVHNWLLQVQASSEAWTLVWQLLEPSKSWEVQFFAATTLHAKISKQWNEVPSDEYSVLQDRLLNCIKQRNVPKVVLSKLCEALAAFLVNSRSTRNKEKDKSLVEELVEILPCESSSSLDLLLSVLSTLPIEFQKRQSGRQNKLGESLINNWSKTTWLLQQVFSMCSQQNGQINDNTLYIMALECAFAWLKLSPLPLEITGQIYPHLLVAASHYAPSRESCDDGSRPWEIVQQCLMIIVTHDELYKRPQTMWEWARSLVTIAQQHGGKHFCEILTAIGEAHSRALVIGLAEGDEMQKYTSQGLIELLLECTEVEGRYPTEETCSGIPLRFWYALQDDVDTLDRPLDTKALFHLKLIYARLAQALLRKATLPESPSEAGDAEQRELFRCYRQDVADTLDYCYRVLRHDLLVLLGQRLSQPQLNSTKWTDVESTLHAFKALAESVGTEESHYIPALMDLILSHIPYDRYPREVLACACSALGAYAEWIGEHPDPWLERVLQLITTGLLKNSGCASFASMALKDVVRECGPHIGPFAPSILNTIGQILQNVTAERADGMRLMYAAGKLLNSLPTVEQQLVHLEATCGVCVVRIRELLEQPVFTARDAVIGLLKMTTTFFSTLEQSIGKAFLDGLIPLFNKIVSHPEWSQDDSTLEAMHVCAQKSLASLDDPVTEAQPLLPILLTSYKTRPHPTALNLLGPLVVLFSRSTNNIIEPVFAELSSLTLAGVRVFRSANGDLSEWSDLLEAYFALLVLVCKKYARMLLQVPDQIPEMLQCGIACLVLPETGVAKTAGSFLSHAILHSPHLQTFIQPIGQELVCAIMHCVVGGHSSRTNLIEPHAEVLWALNKTCEKWTAQWLQFALQERVGSAATESQKETFRCSVLRPGMNMIRISDQMKNFSLQCRQPRIGL